MFISRKPDAGVAVITDRRFQTDAEMIQDKKTWNKAKTNWVPYVLVLPLFIIIAVFLVVPLVNSFIVSFSTYTAPMQYDLSKPTITNYIKFFSSTTNLSVMARTIRLSVITTILCIVLGYPAAYYMTKLKGRAQQLYLLVYLAPWMINVVVKALGWQILLSNNGIINSALMTLGITSGPIKMMFTEFAVTLGVTHGSMVFAILPIYTSLCAIDPNIGYAAQNLGATKRQVFFKVTLPLSRNGILSGSLIVFAMTMATYTTPVLLGGSKNHVMSYLVQEQSTKLMNWPYGGAISFILVICSLVLTAVIQRVFEDKRRMDVM